MSCDKFQQTYLPIIIIHNRNLSLKINLIILDSTIAEIIYYSYSLTVGSIYDTYSSLKTFA